MGPYGHGGAQLSAGAWLFCRLCTAAKQSYHASGLDYILQRGILRRPPNSRRASEASATSMGIPLTPRDSCKGISAAQPAPPLRLLPAPSGLARAQVKPRWISLGQPRKAFKCAEAKSLT